MLCWSRCENTGLADLIDTFYSSGRVTRSQQMWDTLPRLRAVGHHGDTGVNPTYGVGVCVHRAVPAQLGSAAADVCHQEEKEDGGNIQAQCRGEETDGVSGI